MNIELKIRGSGNPQEVSAALIQIAQDISLGNHINGINERGKCEWEDPCLMCLITEEIL